ncbi:6-pyruvoyl trahydropterin synthase family protein [Halobaculum gomorrense]|uniref:6-pyruvoyltetrahydropterin/6-carboxytetrahydropterin synthase n=1 Tax=Halobaculum gomorrense TaxID=43928 RepID=A0A1M5U0Z2_9EURY|nr:6-carboxytetrahydropterin synthase [Halobaculum gomorrense]SHH56755.1 6-pyruvoyltetrahydropterin/6-carboxytetrahydropterin synthase [Halobaculum gomorrense]
MTESVLKEDEERAELDDRAVVDRLADAGDRELSVGRDRPLRISAGHRLLRHDGKCSRPHGHNYEIRVRITGELGPEGWVVDKGDVTAVVDEWDHRFLVEEGDPLVEGFEASGDGDALVVLDAPPTAEVMSLVLEEKLRERLSDRVSDVTVEVSETSELCAGGI